MQKRFFVWHGSSFHSVSHTHTLSHNCSPLRAGISAMQISSARGIHVSHTPFNVSARGVWKYYMWRASRNWKRPPAVGAFVHLYCDRPSQSGGITTSAPLTRSRVGMKLADSLWCVLAWEKRLSAATRKRPAISGWLHVQEEKALDFFKQIFLSVRGNGNAKWLYSLRRRRQPSPGSAVPLALFNEHCTHIHTQPCQQQLTEVQATSN